MIFLKMKCLKSGWSIVYTFVLRDHMPQTWSAVRGL